METLQYLEQYRQVKTLKSGTRVLLRPLTPNDADELVTFFKTATPQDLIYMRREVSDEAMVKSWAHEVDLLKVFPLIAEVNNRIVGDATLHFGTAHHRHLCWIRIFLAPDWRRKGIGSLMLSALVDVARRLGMQQIIAEVLSNKVQVGKAFETLKFQKEYCHRDYFITPSGEMLDVDVYVLRLIEPGEEF